MKNKDSKTDDIRKKTAAPVIGENIHFQKTVVKTLEEGIGDMVDQSVNYKNNPLPSRTGFFAEADHCASFNSRKALERSGVRAVREANGNHGDYRIVDGDRIIGKGEVKYHGTAEKTENAMRGYGDRQLVGPSDQVDDIRRISGIKEAKGKTSPRLSRQKVGSEHEQVRRNATDKISDGKTSSTPRTLKEMKRRTRKAGRKEMSLTDAMPSMKESLKTAATSGLKSGACVGGILGGGISLIDNAAACMNGEKEVIDALGDAVAGVAAAAVDGGVKGAAGSAATTAGIYIAEKAASSTLKSVCRSSAPAAVAIGLLDVAKSGVELANGSIDGDEFVEKTGKTAATTAGAWAGGETGAAIGTMVCPGVGTIIGGICGGLAGALGISSLFDD